ncbi:MAG TPA: preprotein translocase subunit YajC [Clostridiales bacterium]|nr:preprotein translocase subunit YajC [Clostridiales bacterium]
MSLLLALDATQIVLICLIAVLVIAYPILITRKNKKETQRMTEQTNSLKRGDKVLTTSGVYGTILEVRQDGTSKQVTIETGSGKYKSYMTIDAYAIYQVIKDQPIETAKDVTKSDEKKDDKKEDKKDEVKAEVKEEKIENGETAQQESDTVAVQPAIEEKPVAVEETSKKPRRKKAN